MIRQLAAALVLIILGAFFILHGIVFGMDLLMLHHTEPMELLYMILALLTMLGVLRWKGNR